MKYSVPTTIGEIFDIFENEVYVPLTNFFLSMPAVVKNITKICLGALLAIFVVKTIRRFIR